MEKNKEFVLWFDQLSIEDVPLVGGKNASLGEMYRNLTGRGVRIPNGFAVTAYAYRYLLEKTGARDKIKAILKDLNCSDMDNLAEHGRRVRDLIRNLEFPKELNDAIAEGYRNLCLQYGQNTDCAIRSSATAEDLPDASFAGQQETYLNVRGAESIVDACKRCFASLFTNRAISYREDKKFDHFSIALSIAVQKMVRSDMACSGVMFSIDTESGFKDAVFINASYGLGENIVQGAVNPDEYYVFKPTLKQGFRPIIKKAIGDKKIKMIYTRDQKHPTKNIEVSREDQKKFVLSDDEILELARMGCSIEDHYSWKKGKYCPMDMEWAKDGTTNQIFIVQARPETVHSQKDHSKLKEYILEEKGNVIIEGHSVGEKIGSGKSHVIKDVHQIGKFQKGEVLVTDMTDPDWEPIMKIAAAIVTNRGGRTCFTGDTKILTNKGFMRFDELFNNHDGLSVPSLNKDSLKVEWKPIIATMKRKSNVIEICASQTGRMLGNNLRLTPDHKMLTFLNGELASKEIKSMINSSDMLTIAQKIPSINQSTDKEKSLAYLLGALSTDGSVYLSKTHGEVQFIQKPTEEKMNFIEEVQRCMVKEFKKPFSICKKKASSGNIRGKPVIGEANAYRCYDKQIAIEVLKHKKELVQNLLCSDEEVIFNFLAGVIDGDGCFNQKSNRINIYVSKIDLLEAIVVGCLRIGFVPQISINRSIHNVQIVEKVEEILKYTKRVKGNYKRIRFGTRFFSARQIFGQSVNVNEIMNRSNKNLLIDDRIITKFINKFDKTTQEKVSKILSSDTRMQRVNFVREVGYDDVYNITVQDNHNYIVFTDRYTPVLVNNCHAAIISRELGIPCIVGSINATEKILSGHDITVDCSSGDVGYVYQGKLRFNVKEIDLNSIPITKTKIMMNIGNPDQAFEQSFIPNEGVGLAREEFIINSYIKVHPLALLRYNELEDKFARRIIDALTYNWADKSKYFVDKLAEGISMIAAAFYPKKVIVRLSDFKSNEYANLIGGKQFEPKEENPMIGWRGASRYYDTKYKPGFNLECKAILKVRNEMGLTNLEVMIPFPRTVAETQKVIDTMAEFGLRKGENGLRIVGMCEIPSNVILADEFLNVVDGFSIGTNDLTQLTLGIDRDSELVSHLYDERNDAVKKLVKQVIEVCNRRGKYIGICGQAPSDYVEFAEFVVECGIQTMSLNPDTVIKTTLAIAALEKKLGKA